MTTPQTPRPHQTDAINACVAGLKRPQSRGQCIMACGTGKTLVGYEVAQGLKVKRLLVLVPSLLLVNQMIREYRARGAKHILSVCSDDSTGGEDAIQISVKELEADNTNDAKAAREFLAGPGQRIVVSTYQSLRSLSSVLSQLEFDLAIFDEAHKTAGGKSKLFAHALTDKGLKCARRLFMTATPRHAKLKEDGSTSQVFAMNDPKVYGPVLYSLPLRTAIEAGIIDDYRIIVALASEQKTDEFRNQAIRVAIDRAMREYGIRKVFAFHAFVADAGGFILGATDTLKDVRLYHVNGKQSRVERELRLEGFRNADRALMTNARCLTEGVDLPAADMVAFLAPKRNPIDIVQAIGRVLRKHPSKAKGGFVFLPVFVRDGEDAEAAIAESAFAGVYDVLQALREQDGPMAAAMSKCARGDGELPDKVLLLDARSPSGTAGLEADRCELSEGMRRAIRVKMMRPFGIDPDGKKAELMELAISGKKRPSDKTALGKALWRYTNPKRDPQHDEFDRAVRLMAPAWFTWKPSEMTASEKKHELLRMARSGESRPSSESTDKRERALGVALSMYSSPNSKSYDDEFAREVRLASPLWFVAAAKEKKDELLRIARVGGKKPRADSENARERELGLALSRYLKSDAIFAREVREASPAWFERPKKEREPKAHLIKARVAANKAELLRMAQEGQERPPASSPDPERRRLGRALENYTCRSSSSYDAEFERNVRAVAPGWSAKHSQEKKAALLDLLSIGARVPPRGTVLGDAFRNYTKRGSKALDPVFVSQVDRIDPTLLERRRARGMSDEQLAQWKSRASKPMASNGR
jgi:superfamily II DNA or RNA helicase